MKTKRARGQWYELHEPSTIPSPCVLVSRTRVVANIEAAIDRAGGPDRLRPHVKTHKSAEVVKLHLERGIVAFKCATLAEAEMIAHTGGGDILVAYQLVGPGPGIVCSLAKQFSDTQFGCLVDNVGALDEIEKSCCEHGVTLTVYLDLDVGMHRTGIAPGAEADALYRRIAESPSVRPGGIHAYDGHVRDTDFTLRCKQAAVIRDIALAMRDRLVGESLPVAEVILGGTPSFPCHAAAYRSGVRLSPGTYVYHDWRNATEQPDLPFRAAAVVFARVISVTQPGRFAIDVGSKAIAADHDQPRGTILNLPAAVAGPQSEEHWVFTIPEEDTPTVGSSVYIWPRHICPTIEHYDAVALLDDCGGIAGHWSVTARGRSIDERRYG